MKQINRRQFILDSAVLASAVSITGAPAIHAADANNRIIIGLIGPGGMGMNHLRNLAEQ